MLVTLDLWLFSISNQFRFSFFLWFYDWGQFVAMCWTHVRWCAVRTQHRPNSIWKTFEKSYMLIVSGTSIVQVFTASRDRLLRNFFELLLCVWDNCNEFWVILRRDYVQVADFLFSGHQLPLHAAQSDYWLFGANRNRAQTINSKYFNAHSRHCARIDLTFSCGRFAVLTISVMMGGLLACLRTKYWLPFYRVCLLLRFNRTFKSDQQ